MADDTRKDDFDPDQGHGDHIECAYDGAPSQFAVLWLTKAARDGDLIGKTREPVANGLGDGFPKKTNAFLLGPLSTPLRAVVLIAEKAPRDNIVVSGYPECEGTAVKVRLTALHEWSNGLEATLEGTVLDGARKIAFFDTRYALHKQDYAVGSEYIFNLAALAYEAEILAEEQRWFKLEGDEARDWMERIGSKISFEPERDDAGQVKCVKMDMSGMVAYFTGPAAYPDDCEFQSPAFGIPEEIEAFDLAFYHFPIAIARDENDVLVPLFAKKSLFARLPTKNDPIRGRLWLQGFIKEN